MCEILLRVRDKESRDVGQRLIQNVAGDAVVIVEDGHRWGGAEVSNPDWRVLQMPGLPAAAVADLMESRPHWKDSDRISARKRQYIDVTDPWLRGVLASGQVIQFTEADAARLLALKRARVDDAVMMVG